MCGRYTLIHSQDAVAQRFAIQQTAFDIVARYNIAPTQQVPIIVEERGTRLLSAFHWGLIPFWAKDPEIGARLINARKETLGEKASFKHALGRRRCLIPADGFYEWRKDGAVKQPMYVRLADESPFAFAGLWEVWQSPDGSPIHSCAIVTMEPNEMMAPIHDRMPAILRREDEAGWLRGPTTAAGGRKQDPSEYAMGLLRPYPSDLMTAYPVSRAVNNPTNDSQQCIAPIGAAA